MTLKPCPFCGGKSRVSFRWRDAYRVDDYKFVMYRVQVICNRCHARGKPVITDWRIIPEGLRRSQVFKEYVDKAVEAWNRRTR